jgi:zinc-binding in reverse transcriptase
MRVEEQLLSILQSLSISTDPDSALWQREPSGLYTVKSMYNFLNSCGISYSFTKSVWSLKIPLKNKLFLWLTLHNKILTKITCLRRVGKLLIIFLWIAPMLFPSGIASLVSIPKVLCYNLAQLLIFGIHACSFPMPICVLGVQCLLL